MANKAMIQRELKRQRLVMKYAQKRALLKAALKAATSLKDKLTIQRQLQQLPRNSAPVIVQRLCKRTGALFRGNCCS